MDVVSIALAKSFAQNHTQITEINKAIAAAEELNSKQDIILDEIKKVNVDQKEAIEILQNTTTIQDKNIKTNSANIAANAENIKANVQSIIDSNNAFNDRIKQVDEKFLAVEENIIKAKSEAIAEILGGAVEQDYDTLKEVVDWIQSDTTGSARLITRVTNLESYTSNLKDIKIPAIEANISTLFERFPVVSVLDNGKFVKVEDGKYKVVEVKFSTIYTGETEPTSELGADGDLYIQYE